MRRKLIGLVFFVASVLVAALSLFSKASATANASNTAYIFTSFTPPAAIMDVAFEGQYVWAATMGGVVRWNRNDSSYETFTMENTPLPDNKVWSVAVDQQGNKWFGTQEGGLVRFDGSTWIIYTTAQELPDNFVSALAVHPNGTIYVGTASGLATFTGKKFVRLPTGGEADLITAIAFSKNQDIWIGTSNFGSYKLSGGKWTAYGNPDVGPGGKIRDITIAPNGDVWFVFADSTSGVGRMSGNVWKRFTTSDGLASNDVRGVTVDATGAVWTTISDPYFGLAKLVGNSWTQVNSRQLTGLFFNNNINKTAVDSTGRMWILLNNFLVSTDGKQEFKVYLAGLPIPPASGLEIAIAPNGDVWFSIGRAGVVRYDGKAWQLFTIADGLGGETIQDIHVDAKGRVWCTVWKEEMWLVGAGISMYDGKKWTTYTTSNGLVSDSVNAIASDKKGNMWFATQQGVSKFNGSTWKTYTSADGLLMDNPSAIAARENDVWISFAGVGLNHFDGSSWETFDTADLGSYGDTIDVDANGNPWISGSLGIAHFDGVDWKTYDVPFDAPVSYVNNLVVDASGDVWVSAYGSNTWIGLVRLSGEKWKAFKSQNNGFLNDEVHKLFINEARNIIWFSNRDDGVTRLLQLYGLNNKVFLPAVTK